jgi:hypothetical protein
MCAMIVGVQGTGMSMSRAQQGVAEPYWVQHLPRFTAIHFPWKESQYSNQCCGVTLAFRRKWINPKTVISIAWPNEQLLGRGGFVRVKSCGRYDFGICVLYFPPLTSRAYKKGFSELLNWTSEVMERLPARRVPLLLMDGNAHLAPVASETRFQKPSVGAFGKGKDCWGGQLLRQFAALHELAIVNTLSPIGAGPTYFSTRYSTRIDYIVMPADMTKQITYCPPDGGKGYQLQLCSALQLLDHIPVEVSFWYRDLHHDPTQPGGLAKHRWTADVLDSLSAQTPLAQ